MSIGYAQSASYRLFTIIIGTATSMPLQEISNAIPAWRGEVSKDFGYRGIEKPWLVTEIAEESPVTTEPSATSLIDFLHAGPADTWTCLLCNIHNISDRNTHVTSVAHINRKGAVGQRELGGYLTFLSPQFNAEGCFAVCPYIWTTCRPLRSNGAGTRPSGIFATHTKNTAVQTSKARSQPPILSTTRPSTSPRPPLLVGSNSPSEANYSWSCGLCNVYGLKAQGYWSHCLGDQHIAASHASLDEQLDEFAQLKSESAASQQAAQKAEASVTTKSTEFNEEASTALRSNRIDVKFVPNSVATAPESSKVLAEQTTLHHPLKIEMPALEEPAELVDVLVNPIHAYDGDIVALSQQDDADVAKGSKLDEPEAFEGKAAVTFEEFERFVDKETADGAEDPVLRAEVATHETPYVLERVPKGDDATLETTVMAPGVFTPVATTVANFSAEEEKRAASVTRNEGNEFWTCSLCSISTLQAHSVMSHLLGKKHIAAFDKKTLPPPAFPMPLGKSTTTELLLEEKRTFDKTIEEAAHTDERFAYVAWVDASSSWLCSLCKILDLHMNDIKPHCYGKRHRAAAFRAEVERPTVEDIGKFRKLLASPNFIILFSINVKPVSYVADRMQN